MCGGTVLNGSSSGLPAGLSPRVRGNLHHSRLKAGRPRSIPACAGEPAPMLMPAHPPRVYPACAGEPNHGIRHNHQYAVYPRVCGGTCSQEAQQTLERGLSPRVRGNRREIMRRPRRAGSIPACAGEPRTPPSSSPRRSVYPRVCGGTIDSSKLATPSIGLSPRVRGNPVGIAGAGYQERSIPACAGEPLASIRAAVTAAVYPRVCGGTSLRPEPVATWRGLSPRVRGNPDSRAA